MASYNRVIMMGNLTRDPELKQLPSGQSVCRLGLASNRQFKNRQSGTMVQEVCFVDVDVWGPQADSCQQYLQKGRGVLVEGRLKLDTWQDQEGQRKSKHSIVADRVTFLASQQDQDSDFSAESTSVEQKTAPKQAKPASEVSKQASPAQTAAPVVTPEPASKAPSTGEVNFKDQEPFEDDLPF